MRRLVAMLAMMVVAALAVGTAVAVEPVKMQATALKLEHAKLPAAELKKLLPPPNTQIGTLVMRHPPTSRKAGTGPDLVPLAPMWLNPPRPGPEAGFPDANFSGWRATWRVKNQGSWVAAPAPWKVHFTCQVINVPPLTEEWELYYVRWCALSSGTFDMPMALAAGDLSPDDSLKTFVGYPLFPCGCGYCPKPRITFKVDSASDIFEPERENNNEFQVDVCTGQ